MASSQLSATEAVRRLADGSLSAEDLVRSCLATIDRREPVVQAWQHLDAEGALRAARAADAAKREGRSLGPLHGLPVGVKDVFDTADMPTENGTVLHAGRRPARDAFVVERLRAAGAIVLGKTVTTELALFSPGKTRNPYDATRTPGGSSSGSAAAVAAEMVPLAIGTQANASLIRPAAYCGVWCLKPSHGLVSQTGVLRQSPFLNHVGVMARSVGDLALAMETLVAPDSSDPTWRAGDRHFVATTAAHPRRPPRIALARTPWWSRADAEVAGMFDRLAQALGAQAEWVTLPPSYEQAIEEHRVIVESDLAHNFRAEYEKGKESLSAQLRGMLESGYGHRATRYVAALEARERLVADLAPLFAGFDAVAVPATTGSAPVGMPTGDPSFCTAWTLNGLPSVAVPSFSPATGLPIGLQLIGPSLQDARLLQVARWLAETAASALVPKKAALPVPLAVTHWPAS